MENKKSSSGIGVTGVLTLIFIVLKLVGVIDWSWWWVLSPLWLGLALFLAVIAFLGIISIIIATIFKN